MECQSPTTTPVLLVVGARIRNRRVIHEVPLQVQNNSVPAGVASLPVHDKVVSWHVECHAKRPTVREVRDTRSAIDEGLYAEASSSRRDGEGPVSL